MKFKEVFLISMCSWVSGYSQNVTGTTYLSDSKDEYGRRLDKSNLQRTPYLLKETENTEDALEFPSYGEAVTFASNNLAIPFGIVKEFRPE